ncbi:scaffolding protein [Roseobacter phage CRP-125]|uniref:Scaffolding protein n=1 Tax=Roseobacter phage CRP-125 TaxID=3072844 RepID=A0AAX3ZWR2_9CAUD|nr:scaffolding protein [Roseobacter phage CRP-125]
MAESITIVAEDTGPEAPVAEDNQSERPEWLPEKFNSPEDLAKSYAELEKKMSAPKDDAPEDPPTEEVEPEQSTGEPQFDKFAEEFASSGELSDDSFDELSKMGYPREMVETYIKGMQSAQTADANAVMDVAGGPEGYQDLTSWAKDNMPENELLLYNQMVETGTDNAKMAVEWLMSKREAAGDVEPNLLSGKSQAPAKDEFRSTAEVVAAMKDARYGKDPAYTRDVEEKLGRSKVF